MHSMRTSYIDVSTPRDKGSPTFLSGQVYIKYLVSFCKTKAAYFPSASIFYFRYVGSVPWLLKYGGLSDSLDRVVAGVELELV